MEEHKRKEMLIEQQRAKVHEALSIPDGGFYPPDAPNYGGVSFIKRLRIKRILATMMVVFALILYFMRMYSFLPWYTSVAGQRPLGRADDGLLDFDDITPSEKLEWHPCFTREPALKCARLTVPMDYHRPLNESKDNPKVHVALVLAPGKHDGPKKFSTSPLLLNPGGPGGSGVAIALILAKQIHALVGEDQDIIGFDPRGIGATTPRADCFSYPIGSANAPQTEGYGTGGGEDYAAGNFNRLLWLTAGTEVGNVNSSSGSWQILDSRAKANAKLCQAKDTIMGKDSIFKYVSTPNVVRDMVSIVDAWDAWTDSQSSLMEKSDGATEDELKQADNGPSTKGKLVYWGFSYGTLLGATFASMFPDRVGRVILDGVVDADHYVAPVWMESIRDADIIFNSLPKYCHEAEELCPLYRSNDVLSDVENRFFGTLENLKANPIILTDKFFKTPIIVTYSDIRRLFFSMLYSPTYGFYAMAWLTDLILQGKLDMLAMIFAIPLPFSNFPDPVCQKPRPAWQYPNEAQVAIMCSDKRYPLNETVPNLKLIFEEMSKVSSWADVWLTVMLGCEGWGIEAIDPPMRWDDHPAHKQQPINTSFPILFISNTYDPVTPLFAGVQMAKKFVNAGLIEQKSMGHCSLAAVSRCTIAKIKAYFKEGKVSPPPKEGGKGKELEDGEWDRCEADEWPFHPYTGERFVTLNGVDAVEEVEAMQAAKEMQEIFARMKHYGQPQVPPNLRPLPGRNFFG